VWEEFSVYTVDALEKGGRRFSFRTRKVEAYRIEDLAGSDHADAAEDEESPIAHALSTTRRA
jgi:hypothetical protein